jgi:hypothetical protein
MTTSYIVELKIDNQIRYVWPNGTIHTMPKFFNNIGRVKAVLNSNRAGYGNSRWQQNNKDSTTVIQIRELENGLKESRAKIMTADEALTLADAPKSGLSIPNNPNAVYMIQLKQEGLSTTPRYITKTGYHAPKNKFGKQWQDGGKLRIYINSRLRHLALGGNLNEATVLEIEMNIDGFTPKQVKSYPIVDFFCASPSSIVHYERQFGKYTPKVTV